MSRADNPELEAAIRDVSVTFDALSKARAKFNRCSRDDSREQARAAMRDAERRYQAASDIRDRLVELDHARRTQSGDPLGAHWAHDHAGPVIDPSAMTLEEEARKLTHCARAACQVYIGQRGYQHKHLPWRYCLACARRINAACPEAPPFDLSAVKETP